MLIRALAVLVLCTTIVSRTETSFELPRRSHNLPSCTTKPELLATWYGEPFHGRARFDGEKFDMNDPSVAASPVLPIGTRLMLRNKDTGQQLLVVILDRMPKEKRSNQIDLSMAGALALGFKEVGSAYLEAEIVE